MTALAIALLVVAALAGGAWLTMFGAVLLVDAMAAFEIHDAAAGIVAARQGFCAAWVGLALFGLGAIAIAKWAML